MRFKTLAVIAAVLIGAGLAAAPAQAAPPVPAAPVTVVKEISVANGWTYVPAAQNALEQKAERNAKALGMDPTTIYGCPWSYTCLYEWINYGGGRWQTNGNAYDLNECWTLTPSNFTTGNPVSNMSASAINNLDTDSFSRFVTFFDWVGCHPESPEFSVDATEPWFRTNLSTVSGNWYHRITSLTFT